MAFTVGDFQDLLRVLDEHPEWQAELRRRMLTDDVLELPGIVRGLAERVNGIAERLDGLTERVDRLAERVGELAEAQRRTEHLLAELIQSQARLEARQGHLEGRQGNLEGRMFELQYVRRAPAYFGRLARRIRVLDPSAVADMLDDAVDVGRLTSAERDDAMLADLVLTGRRRDDQREVYYVVELSMGVGEHDVRRAADRAAILAKLGHAAVPAVAGESITAEAALIAQAGGVLQVLDGRALPAA